jgi:hypothetical protein
MTDAPTSDLFRVKRGVTVLATCLVQTLNETDPTFQDRPLKRLERSYYKIREGRVWEGDVLEELGLLKLMRELLEGKEQPFSSD